MIHNENTWRDLCPRGRGCPTCDTGRATFSREWSRNVRLHIMIDDAFRAHKLRPFVPAIDEFDLLPDARNRWDVRNG